MHILDGEATVIGFLGDENVIDIVIHGKCASFSPFRCKVSFRECALTLQLVCRT